MSNNLENVFLRLGYALRELKQYKNNTIILGAGCSLSSTSKDVSTVGIMRQCLLEHEVPDVFDYSWDDLYRKFINVVWQGKAIKEQELLLKSKLNDIEPSDGHKHLRTLIENKYINTVITTNFDMLLEKAFKGLSYRKRVGNAEYKTIGDNPTFDILKVHGDLEEGQFRFSPDELMKLPDDLQKDIAEKTSGLLLFIGYRGQDVGLMNALSKLNAYATYWIDINELNVMDPFLTKHISDFMYKRNSLNNFLYGKEFGDFNEIFKKLNSFLISPTRNSVIKSKETNLNNEWKSTSIVELLSIYTRVHELFLDILNISKIVQEKFTWRTAYPAYSSNYDELLHSYLYFFNSKKLPSNLLHIPNNEIDALVFGVSIEVLVRTLGNGVAPKKFIIELRTEFERSDHNKQLINDSFWLAVEKIVCSEIETDNVIKLHMQNKLTLQSHDVPLEEFNELLRVVHFLSLFIPITQTDSNKIDVKYKLRQFLNGKCDTIDFANSRINIDLGKISSEDIEPLMEFYLNDLPGFHKSSSEEEVYDNKKRIILESKWIIIRLEVEPKDDYHEKNSESLYSLIQERGKNSAQQFLNLGNVFNTSSDKHVDLVFDKDLKKFVESDRTAMFAIGPSGSGKTSALQNFVRNNKDNEDMIIIIISPKNVIIDKYGLSLFLDLKTDSIAEDSSLKNINIALALRCKNLVFIFDGLNEINDTIEKQQVHYCKLIDLADKLHRNKCDNIKLVITCRKNAYYQYQNSSMLQLNPIYFYNNNKSEIGLQKNQDASYKIMSLNSTDQEKLINQYINTDLQAQLNSANMFTFLNPAKTLQSPITPLFIAITGESLGSFKGIDIIRKGGTVYDLFANTMIGRIEQADAHFAKKIIYTYFDLIVEYRKTRMEVTRFKILDNIHIQYHSRFDEIINKMIDVNILVKDYSNLKRIKFQHDKIEEFFFKEYIEEYEHKGLSFINNIFDLSQKNVIYQGGLLHYFLDLIKKKRLNALKDITIALFIDHMNLLPKMIVEALLYSTDLTHNLEYLLSTDDVEDSKKMLNAIVWGLDDCLQDYSIVTCDLMKIIDNLLSMSDDSIITKEKRSYLFFFKSKLYYFMNDYNNAQVFSDRAVELIGNANKILLSKINIHYSVILMELGFSRKSIELLEKEFELQKEISDLKAFLEIGIELGRALNHSGQVERTLDLYALLLENEKDIADPYILARIYEQKANVLNKIMYEKLQYGFIEKEQLAADIFIEVQSLFNEAI